MPLAPGTPYRNEHASPISSEWESELASMRSSHPTPHDRPMSPTAVPHEEHTDIPLGDLWHRRQSRKLELAGLGISRPETTLDPDRGSQMYGVEQRLETEAWGGEAADRRSKQQTGGDELNIQRPDNAHLRTSLQTVAECDLPAEPVLERQERDLEAADDAFLTRREKKEWALTLIIGGLSVCAMCGLIAGLAVS